MGSNNMARYDLLYSSIDCSGSTQFLMLREQYKRTFYLGLPLPFCRSATSGTTSSCKESHRIRSDVSCGNSCICSLLSIQHPFVWGAQDTLYGSSGQRFAILPYPWGGSLNSLIFRCRQKREYLSEAQACFFFCQAVAAVDALHMHGISHGNLSSKQFFFMDQAGERLALSLLEAKARTLGSYAMTANEGTSVHTNNVLDTPAGLQAEARTDIRALGKLLYELCCLEPPQYMSCISGSELSCQVANEANDGSRWSQLRQGGVPQAAGSWGLENVTRKQQLYPPISQRYRPEVAQLVHLLLLGEARTLPTAAGILGMPFLETSRKAVAMQLSKFPQNEESSAVVAHDYGRTSMPLRSKSASLHIDLYIVPRVRIRCSFRRSAATDPNTGSYDWLFYVFPRDTDPSQPTVQQATREPVGEKASPCLRVADSTAPLTSKQEEIIFNSRPSLVASTWTENCRCGEQLVEGGRNIGAGELSSAQGSNNPHENATPEVNAKLRNCVPKAQDHSASHEMQKDPKYLAYLADVVDGPTAAKMGQQLQPQKNEPLFGEAAVNAVLTAQKLRRKQQIAERECQLSKIRSEYAKDKKAVEETVRNRLLQEGNRGTPMQISAKQRKMKTGASILPNDGTCTWCCLSPRSCSCGLALRASPDNAGMDAAAAAPSAARGFDATWLSDTAPSCTPAEQHNSPLDSHCSRKAHQFALAKPVGSSFEDRQKLRSGIEASQRSPLQLGTNATENAHQTYLGSTANPVAVPFTPSSQYSDLRRLAKGWENMKDSIPVEVSVPPCAVPSACKTAKEEGSMEATLDSPTNAAASLRVKDSRMAGMAQDSRNIHRPQKEEQDPNVQEVTIDHSVASCTVTDEVWRQQQQHVLPVAFWESIDPNEGFTTMELSVSETISVPLPDSVGHHQLRRFVQQPTLHVRVGLREDETCCSCTEECQLLPVAHFALSSTGCSN